MTVKYLISVLCVAMMLVSCTKEIDLPYRSIESINVIEGSVTNEETKVAITGTVDMNDTVSTTPKENARVYVVSDDATSELFLASDGFYRPVNELIGVVGKTYKLKVELDNVTYESSSTMQEVARIDTVYFDWVKMMNTRTFFVNIKVSDVLDEENYYCFRILRNGKVYRWNLFNDKGNANGTINLNIPCMSEDMANENDEEDWEDILYEGDKLSISVETIDRRTYDYLKSLALSERGDSNPIPNFSAPCLGYFAAFAVAKCEIIVEY